MRKIDEIKDPKSCLNKASLHERIFVLLPRDAAAPSTIRYWCAKRIQLGKNHEGDPQIVEALQCADLMEQGWE